MRRPALIGTVIIALLVALVVGTRLAPFWGPEDRCLDRGGVVLRASNECELAVGHSVPLTDYSADAWSWVMLGIVSLLPGALLVGVVHLATRRRSTEM